MTSQPDKLFRDKLESFQRPAPAAAWDRIEQKLEKPASKIVWLRIAAGIVLLSIAAFLLWPAGSSQTVLTKTDGLTPDKRNDAVHKDVPEQPKEITPELKIVTPVQTHTASVQKKFQKQIKKQVEPKQNPSSDSVSIILPVPQTPELIADVQPEVKQPVSTTIVYTADDMNSKFLKKKLPPQATSASREASGIQKLIGLAYSAKNSDTGLGDLRQKKDEILTLNFGKKKGEN